MVTGSLGGTNCNAAKLISISLFLRMTLHWQCLMLKSPYFKTLNFAVPQGAWNLFDIRQAILSLGHVPWRNSPEFRFRDSPWGQSSSVMTRRKLQRFTMFHRFTFGKALFRSCGLVYASLFAATWFSWQLWFIVILVILCFFVLNWDSNGF